jgi:uncharacterized membrane protein
MKIKNNIPLETVLIIFLWNFLSATYYALGGLLGFLLSQIFLVLALIIGLLLMEKIK